MEYLPDVTRVLLGIFPAGPSSHKGIVGGHIGQFPCPSCPEHEGVQDEEEQEAKVQRDTMAQGGQVDRYIARVLPLVLYRHGHVCHI